MTHALKPTKRSTAYAPSILMPEPFGPSWLTEPIFAPREETTSRPTMRTMSPKEIDAFVSRSGFGVLALAEGNRAYGVPLFYGARHGEIYFQTRAGQKTHYLYATTEACLTISSTRGLGEWASVQLIGRLERVDARVAGSSASGAVEGVPPPLLWAEDDTRSDEPHLGGMTTFRLIPTQRIGRYSQPARETSTDRELGYRGM
jgi:hypothetical protein